MAWGMAKNRPHGFDPLQTLNPETQKKNSHDSYYKNKADVDRDCGGNWDCPEALHTRELVPTPTLHFSLYTSILGDI